MERAASLVCGVDHSSGARAAARFAGDLADRLATRVVLVHAVQPPLPQSEPGMAAGTTAVGAPNWEVLDQLRAAGADLLEELSRELSASLEVVTELKVGDASDVVAAAAEHYGAEFLLVGSRGLGSVGALILGSVSLRLAVHAPCPTVVVPESADTIGDGPILCAVDDSEAARTAASTAATLSERLNASLVLVHVGAENAPAGHEGELLARLATGIGLRSSAETALARGDPAAAIVEAAATYGAAMIVIGSRGRGALASAVLGSVSSAVATHSPRAVMVVREHQSDIADD